MEHIAGKKSDDDDEAKQELQRWLNEDSRFL
jgi:hypothetical protein